MAYLFVKASRRQSRSHEKGGPEILRIEHHSPAIAQIIPNCETDHPCELEGCALRLHLGLGARSASGPGLGCGVGS